MYVNSSDLNSPVAMETDFPLIEDVQRLKKTVEEGATQVNLTFSLSLFSPFKTALCGDNIPERKKHCFLNQQSLLLCSLVIVLPFEIEIEVFLRKLTLNPTFLFTSVFVPMLSELLWSAEEFSMS